METVSIKTRKTFEQSGVALYQYLSKKGISCKLLLNEEKPHKSTTVLDLNKHCVNTNLFVQDNESRFLDTIYFGDFSLKKMDELFKRSDDLNIRNLHLFSYTRWPIHNFIGIVQYEDLGELFQMYKNFICIDDDPDWIYMSFVYSGCNPLIKRDIKVYTVDDYAKELGFE